MIMIQRKQTLFLLVALVLTIACLCLPVATFVPQGMGVSDQMFNLWLVDGNGARHLAVWPLFAVLLTTAPINVATIFAYKNRKLQARLCLLLMMLILGWYGIYAVFSKIASAGSFRVAIAAAFPLVALIFYFMARRAILADEALVRAADRIR